MRGKFFPPLLALAFTGATFGFIHIVFPALCDGELNLEGVRPGMSREQVLNQVGGWSKSFFGDETMSDPDLSFGVPGSPNPFDFKEMDHQMAPKLDVISRRIRWFHSGIAYGKILYKGRHPLASARLLYAPHTDTSPGEPLTQLTKSLGEPSCLLREARVGNPDNENYRPASDFLFYRQTGLVVHVDPQTERLLGFALVAPDSVYYHNCLRWPPYYK